MTFDSSLIMLLMALIFLIIAMYVMFNGYKAEANRALPDVVFNQVSALLSTRDRDIAMLMERVDDQRNKMEMLENKLVRLRHVVILLWGDILKLNTQIQEMGGVPDVDIEQLGVKITEIFDTSDFSFNVDERDKIRIGDLQKLLTHHSRRLQELLEIKAKKGGETEVHILTEIDEARDEIDRIKSELEKLNAREA